MISFIIWGLLLILQNAAFTWVSRARNSGDVAYHALAAMCSNGIWFICQVILLDTMMDVFRLKAWGVLGLIGVYYVFCTVLGSVLMHILSMNYLEKGRRKVGA